MGGMGISYITYLEATRHSYGYMTARSSGLVWYIEGYHRRVSKGGCLYLKRCFLEDN